MSKQQHSLSANLAGSLFIGLLIHTPLIFVALLISRKFSTIDIRIDDVISISLLATLVSTVTIALFDRSYRIKNDTYVPAGLVPTLYEAVPWVVVTSATAVVLLQTYDGKVALLGAVAGIAGGTLPALALNTPWKGALTDSEYEEKLRKGNEIIKEGFEEIREEVEQRRWGSRG